MRATMSALVAAALAATGAVVVVGGSSFGSAPSTAVAPQEPRSSFRITNDPTAQARLVNEVGVDVEGPLRRGSVITGTDAQVSRLRAAGLVLTPARSAADLANDRVEQVRKARLEQGIAPEKRDGRDFPAGDEAYHTYDETIAFIDQTVSRYPDLARKQSVGRSAEGRDLAFLRLGKAPEGSPEIVVTCNIHAREHLTTEQCIYIANELTGKYATDSRIRQIMDTRIVWVLPMMNPDGSTYDIASGRYAGWRKNRTRNSDGSVGIDLNRNFSYNWGCCGGASSDPRSDTYRGPSAMAGPEVRQVTDFIKSRRVGGEQRVKAFMDIHTFSEIVMFPFGYTKNQVVDRMTRDQYDMHQALARKLASSNQYSPEQSSKMYITDGDSMDWAWGDQQIPTIGVEMYPRSGGGGLNGFYPPASVIPRETARNREMLLTYFELADCQYKLTGKQDKYCAKPTPTASTTTTPTTSRPTSTTTTTAPTSTSTTTEPTATSSTSWPSPTWETPTVSTTLTTQPTGSSSTPGPTWTIPGPKPTGTATTSPTWTIPGPKPTGTATTSATWTIPGPKPAGTATTSPTWTIPGPKPAGTATTSATWTIPGPKPAGTATTSPTWTIPGPKPTGAPTMSQPGPSAITNGGFDQGSAGWTGTLEAITRNNNQPAHGGSYKLWLAGNGRRASEAVSQRVTVPANGKLTYWLHVTTEERTRWSRYDTAAILIDGRPVAMFSNLDAGDGYVQRTIDLSRFAGRTVTLSFAAKEDGAYATSFVFDDLMLG